MVKTESNYEIVVQMVWVIPKNILKEAFSTTIIDHIEIVILLLNKSCQGFQGSQLGEGLSCLQDEVS